MATVFAAPANNVSTTVGTAGYTAGAGSLILATGGGALFPTLSGGQFYRVTVCQVAFAYSPTASTSNYTIYKATGKSTDTLTGLSVLEGTTDRNYAAGDIVEVRVTAGTLIDIQTAVNTLETSGGGMAIGNTVTSGTSKSVLYVDSTGKLAQDNAKLTWDDSANTLTVTGSGGNSVITVNNNYTGAGVGSVNYYRANSATHNIFQFVSGYDLSSTNPLYSFGVGAGLTSFQIGSWNGSTAKTYITIASPTNNNLVTLGAGQNVLIRADGSIGLASIANASAVNNSLFWDTTASKLTYKDGSGTLHAI